MLRWWRGFRFRSWKLMRVSKAWRLSFWCSYLVSAIFYRAWFSIRIQNASQLFTTKHSTIIYTTFQCSFSNTSIALPTCLTNLLEHPRSSSSHSGRKTPSFPRPPISRTRMFYRAPRSSSPLLVSCGMILKAIESSISERAIEPLDARRQTEEEGLATEQQTVSSR
jgi:hypothetical protein